MEKNIVAEIVEQRKQDIQRLGYTFGHEIPEKRTRPVTPFMQNRGVILEVKRASPSKGDIAPGLDSAATARAYCENGAAAISCLTEENYFKGTLEDLQKVCAAVDKFALETGKARPAVLRKDFLIDEEEIEIAYRCGADAVLLISGILSLEKMLSMTERCKKLGIRALVEVRTEEDAAKVLEVKKQFSDTIVCGVNSRNLKDFKIDLLVPAQLKNILGGQVIFESGITTPQAAAMAGSMGFAGILLGEFAARNPQKAGEFVKAFTSAKENANGKNWLEIAEMIKGMLKQVQHDDFGVQHDDFGVQHDDFGVQHDDFGIQHDKEDRHPEQEGRHPEQEDRHPEQEDRHPELDSGSYKGDRPLVKICGLTKPEDVLFADQLGADFVGFIFAAGFGRNVYGERFEKIGQILPEVRAKKVAVITAAEGEEAHAAAKLVSEGVLDMLQLHGIDYKKVPEYLKAVPHYFAVTDKTGRNGHSEGKGCHPEQEDCHPEQENCKPEQEDRHPELDSGSEQGMLKQVQHDNIGESLAEQLFAYGEPRFLQDSRSHRYDTKNGKLWLAGGVTPENAAELIKEFHPELIDVSSGLEDSAENGGTVGVKNHEKMKKFFEAVRG